MIVTPLKGLPVRLPNVLRNRMASFLALEEVLLLRSSCCTMFDHFGPLSEVWRMIDPPDMRHIFRKASARGLQFINQIFCLLSADAGVESDDAIREGPLLGPTHLEEDSALAAACAANDAEKIAWLAMRFPYLWGTIAKAAARAAERGHLVALGYITTIYGIAFLRDICASFALAVLRAALDGGQPAAAEFAVALGGPGMFTHPSDTFSVLRAACRGPSLAALQSLAARLRITRRDVLAGEWHLLGEACIHGRTHSALWLLERFAIGASDLRRTRFAALRRACDSGQHRVAALLLRWLGGADDFRAHLTAPELAEHWARLAPLLAPTVVPVLTVVPVRAIVVAPTMSSPASKKKGRHAVRRPRTAIA